MKKLSETPSSLIQLAPYLFLTQYLINIESLCLAILKPTLANLFF